MRKMKIEEIKKQKTNEEKEKILHTLAANTVVGKDLYNDWIEGIKNKKRSLYAIKNNDLQDVGYFLLARRKKNLEITSIYIKENFRRKGYAENTINEILNSAYNNDIDYVTTYADPQNPAGKYLAFLKNFTAFPNMKDDLGEINVRAINGKSDLESMKEVARKILIEDLKLEKEDAER